MSGNIVDIEIESRRSEIVLRRLEHFFGDGGLCERYELIGDELIQFHEIAHVLADTVRGLSYEAVLRRFVFSVRRGSFGFHEPGRARRAVAHLLDLDSFTSFAVACYPLRPSTLTVEMAPQLMRARRSVWAKWIRTQGWPVPIEFAAAAIEAATESANEFGRPTMRHAPDDPSDVSARSAPALLEKPAPAVQLAEPAVSTDANARARRHSTIRTALKLGTRPGTNFPWGRFCHEIMTKCGAQETDRGFGKRQIERIVKDELSRLI